MRQQQNNNWIKIAILGFNGVIILFILFAVIFARSRAVPDRELLEIDMYETVPERIGKVNSNTHSAEDSFTKPERVVELLQYDDFMNRDFHLSGESINLLLFYWSPGKVENNRILSHTPDVCWTRKGWEQIEIVDLKTHLPSPTSDLRHPISHIPSSISDLRAFSSLTSRCFAFGNERVYVYYALFDGGEVVDVDDPLTARFKKVFIDSFSPKKAKGGNHKFYVRFTSEKPIEWWLENPEFWELLEAIHEMTSASQDDESSGVVR